MQNPYTDADCLSRDNRRQANILGRSSFGHADDITAEQRSLQPHQIQDNNTKLQFKVGWHRS